MRVVHFRWHIPRSLSFTAQFWITVFFLLFLRQIFIWLFPRTDYDFLVHQKAFISPGALRQSRTGSLFCWATTSEKAHTTRALAVNSTWFPRCDSSIFFTNAHFNVPSIPYTTLFAPIPNIYAITGSRSRIAMHYVFKNISSRFDWYLKTDDDTYVFVDRLREYLTRFDSNRPYFLGFRMKPQAYPLKLLGQDPVELEHGYNSGGAGYVLSRAAMEIYVNQLFPNKTLCPWLVAEDIQLATCLANIGIYPTDTRDEHGAQRFLPYRFDHHFFGTTPGIQPAEAWIMDPVIRGYDGISSQVITLHHLTPEQIRLIDFLERSHKTQNAGKRGLTKRRKRKKAYTSRNTSIVTN